jgi:hypothetical protein
MRKVALVFVLAVAAGLPARGNDSTAELSTGGLIFVQNDDVEMWSEDLFISTAEIRVRYRFFNKSAKDVTVLVAFPMPEVARDVAGGVAIPSDDPVNLLDFTTRVNRRPVKADVEQRVFANGVEHTATLRNLRIPLAPHLQAAAKALDALPREKWDEFVRLGLAEVEEYSTSANGTREKHLVPRWTLRTTFFWQQTFPAQKQTVIEHRYKPSVGGTVQTSLAVPDTAGEPWIKEYMAKYCIEGGILNRLDRARRIARSDGGPPYSEERIDYILKTGANWSGPIRDFRLVVDKGSVRNLVTFCGDGVRRIGLTRFEIRKKDFTPKGNFSVLILKPFSRF